MAYVAQFFLIIYPLFLGLWYAMAVTGGNWDGHNAEEPMEGE